MTRICRPFGLRFLISALVVATTVGSQAQEAQVRPRRIPDIVSQSRASLVSVSVFNRDGYESGAGCGFVVDASGLIATNLHVIGQNRRFRMELGDGRALNVLGLHAFDQDMDLAIVRVAEQDLPALRLGDLSTLAVGSPVVVLGNPHGLKGSVVTGLVNSGLRDVDGRRMIQLAVPVEPGNSGGPVLDEEGHVHGVVTMKSAVTDNLAFALDVSTVKALLANPNPVTLDRWLQLGGLDENKWRNLYGARWQPRGGSIVVSGYGEEFGGRSLCLWKPPAPSIPYEVAVDARLSSEDGAAGLVIHSDGGFRHYGFYPSNGKLRLTFFNGANVLDWRILHDEASSHYLEGEFNSLKVRIEADRLICFVNDQQVCSTTGLALTEGHVGLVKFRDTIAEFRGFRVGQQLAPSPLAPPRLAAVERLVDAIPSMETWSAEDVTPLLSTPTESQRVLRQRARSLEVRAQELRRLADDVRSRSACKRLAEMLAAYDERVSSGATAGPPFDLLRAALLISLLDEGHIDIDAYVGEVDDMAIQVRASLAPDANENERLEAMNRYLFEENGFHGSRFDYYQRANSYMSRVISDRVGIPISLSVLYMELGHRLGLTIEGMNFPGHFMVRFVPSEGEAKIVDVFRDAEPVPADRVTQLSKVVGDDVLAGNVALADHRDILRRMLTNLMHLAGQRDDREALLRYFEMMVVIDPHDAELRGQRAYLRYQTGRTKAAVADLDWLLARISPAVDQERFDQIRRLRDAFLRETAD